MSTVDFFLYALVFVSALLLFCLVCCCIVKCAFKAGLKDKLEEMTAKAHQELKEVEEGGSDQEDGKQEQDKGGEERRNDRDPRTERSLEHGDEDEETVSTQMDYS